MRTFAYCCKSFRESVRKAAACEPLLSPPTTVETFQPACLQGHHFIYFKLHGLPDQPFWYGDHWCTAVSAEQIQAANLHGAVVFVANCYLLPPPEERLAGRTTPMLDALQAAGARAIIGGDGQNYARANTIDGADALGIFIRVWLERGFTPPNAFRYAKRLLRFVSAARPAIQDALRFDFYTGDDHADQP